MKITRKGTIITLKTNVVEIKRLISYIERAGFELSDLSLRAALIGEKDISIERQMQLDDCKMFYNQLEKVIE